MKIVGSRLDGEDMWPDTWRRTNLSWLEKGTRILKNIHSPRLHRMKVKFVPSNAKRKCVHVCVCAISAPFFLLDFVKVCFCLFFHCPAYAHVYLPHSECFQTRWLFLICTLRTTGLGLPIERKKAHRKKSFIKAEGIYFDNGIREAVYYVPQLLLTRRPLLRAVSLHSVAIVGAGIGGTAAAYFLRQEFGASVKIDIFEPGNVGGRLATENIAGGEYETGGAIIHPLNLHMKHFVDKLGKHGHALCQEGRGCKYSLICCKILTVHICLHLPIQRSLAIF